jgi:UDP-2,4-diacetamido-2,4,6-trideoxy-beta-L-altropyranose hydrolase
MVDPKANGERLLIRADGGPQIGTGHLMRCLALAQQWLVMRGPVTFLLAADVPAFRARLQAEGGQLQLIAAEPGSEADARATLAAASALDARWIVCDGYHFGADYQRWLRAGDRKLLFVDDYGHGEPYCADLVLNHNLYADGASYARREPHTELLLGARYTLLRSEFLTAERPDRVAPERARRILITLGGADPTNFTATAVSALAGLDPALEALVLVGGSNPHQASIERAAAQLGSRAQILSAVDDMPARMAWAELAVTAGGSTCWELLYMGVPALVVVLADNQIRVAEAVARNGAGLDLGEATSLDSAQLERAVAGLAGDRAARQAMVRSGQSRVDGRGAARVVAQMR